MKHLVAKKNMRSMQCCSRNLLTNIGGVYILAYRWVESEATKDGVDADIAKYDGEWAVESPTTGGFSEDRGLVMKVTSLLIFHVSRLLVLYFRRLLSIMQHL